jgi:hypothetical protein
VKLWKKLFGAVPLRGALRHSFVIGPLYQSPLFERKARLYYCAGCRWSFLVSGATVAALDERGNPIARAEGAARFATFEEGPCPAAVESLAAAGTVSPMPLSRPLDKPWPAPSAGESQARHLISIPGTGSLRSARS